MEENNTNTQKQEQVSIDTNKARTEKMSTKLIGLTWNKANDGTPILCAIVKDGNLHTKTTSRSYLTALDGEAGAVSFVKEKLDAGAVEILSGALISWERTTYPANVPHERNGETVVLDKEDVIDHIVRVDLQPIADILLLKYLEEHNQSLTNLQERLLQKSFGVEL